MCTALASACGERGAKEIQELRVKEPLFHLSSTRHAACGINDDGRVVLCVVLLDFACKWFPNQKGISCGELGRGACRKCTRALQALRAQEPYKLFVPKIGTAVVSCAPCPLRLAQRSLHHSAGRLLGNTKNRRKQFGNFCLFQKLTGAVNDLAYGSRSLWVSLSLFVVSLGLSLSVVVSLCLSCLSLSLSLSLFLHLCLWSSFSGHDGVVMA
eukprot:scaffold2114_cov253-Pinguiococcus_pyrenoidosus.AAC.14